MSIFKTSGIVLKINKLKDNEFLIYVFSYDYGKLNLKVNLSKNKKSLDIGYIINFEIYNKKELNISEVKNIKILKEFNYDNKSYEIIILFLNLLKYIFDETAFNNPVYEIYNIIYFLNNYDEITTQKVILSHLKIKNILGLLNIDSTNQDIRKILYFVSKENIKNIFRLEKLNIEILKDLEKLIK
ncbi:recombination protein O N-terminal domain-containing protein [Candidatus Gracilibacteria bacterium]|nr:recombination protein O N-terminal domain-containing protein [Candidatus Gracilibacteria bacterium]